MHFSRKKKCSRKFIKKEKKYLTPIVFAKIYSQNAKFARNFASFWHFSLHSMFALKCETFCSLQTLIGTSSIHGRALGVQPPPPGSVKYSLNGILRSQWKERNVSTPWKNPVYASDFDWNVSTPGKIPVYAPHLIGMIQDTINIWVNVNNFRKCGEKEISLGHKLWSSN